MKRTILDQHQQRSAFSERWKRFLWSSERTGFRHLYLYDLEGKQLAQITKGDWEVSAVDRSR